MTDQEIEKLSASVEAFAVNFLTKRKISFKSFKLERFTPHNMCIYCNIKGWLNIAEAPLCYELGTAILREFEQLRNFSINGNIGNRALLYTARY